jgi:hypothetical protein
MRKHFLEWGQYEDIVFYACCETIGSRHTTAAGGRHCERGAFSPTV